MSETINELPSITATDPATAPGVPDQNVVYWHEPSKQKEVAELLVTEGPTEGKRQVQGIRSARAISRSEIGQGVNELGLPVRVNVCPKLYVHDTEYRTEY